MRLVLISDNHDQNLRTKWAIPDGDVLVHVGDLVGVGDKIERFRRGVRNLRRFPHTHKIYVPGNHDRLALTEPDVVRPLFEAAGIKFLLDESHRIGRVTFWGSPWLNPRTGMFGEYQGDMGELWGRVPAGIDVLLTHVPPAGVLDRSAKSGENIGCPTLASHVIYRIRPTLHVFGHNHMGHGEEHIDGIRFVNAALCDDDYRPAHQPLTAELTA